MPLPVHGSEPLLVEYEKRNETHLNGESHSLRLPFEVNGNAKNETEWCHEFAILPFRNFAGDQYDHLAKPVTGQPGPQPQPAASNSVRPLASRTVAFFPARCTLLVVRPLALRKVVSVKF